MIFIDSGEVNTLKLLTDNITILPNLEAITGADLMISLAGMPASTETLVKQHLAANAILVQRKSGLDLSSSVGTRMNSSIARMKALGAAPWQCLLLFIGVLTCSVDGNAVIDGRDTGRPFFAIQGAISKWHDRGGTFESLPKRSLLEEWFMMKHKHLIEYDEQPEREVWLQTDNLFANEQQAQFMDVVPRDNGRYILNSVYGLGQKTVNKLYEHFDGDVASALCWLSLPKVADKDKIPGIGQKTRDNFRKQLGIDEMMVLMPTVDEYLYEKLKKEKGL